MWKLLNSTATIFPSNYRFTKELNCNLIWRKKISRQWISRFSTLCRSNPCWKCLTCVQLIWNSRFIYKKIGLVSSKYRSIFRNVLEHFHGNKSNTTLVDTLHGSKFCRLDEIIQYIFLPAWHGINFSSKGPFYPSGKKLLWAKKYDVKTPVHLIQY